MGNLRGKIPLGGNTDTNLLRKGSNELRAQGKFVELLFNGKRFFGWEEKSSLLMSCWFFFNFSLFLKEFLNPGSQDNLLWT